MAVARRLSVVAMVAAACAAIGLALPGIAGAAGKRAKTKVTLQSWPDEGFFGYVKSPRTGACADGRKVKLLRKQGDRRNPRKDERIGTARAHRNNGSFQWTMRTDESGDFYARAARKPRCKAAASKTASAPSGSEVSACPSSDDVCRFDRMHVDFERCPDFRNPSGSCSGRSTDGPYPWSPAWGAFHWHEDQPGSRHRTIDYLAKLDDAHSYVYATLEGSLPDPGSANFSVFRATAVNWRDTWNTPDLPGVAPGQQGGPLYLNFVGGVFGADVYIHGYLFRKKK